MCGNERHRVEVKCHIRTPGSDSWLHFLPACALRVGGELSSTWVPTSYVGNLGWLSVCCLEPQPRPGHCWHLREWISQWELVCSSLCLPSKYIFFEGKYFNLHLIKEVKNNFNADCTVVIFISMNKLKINSWILSQSFKNRVYLFSFKIRIPWKYESGQNWALILVSHIFITHGWCFLPAPCRVPQQTHTSDLTSEMQCINSKLQLGKCVLQYRCFEK